MWVCVCADVIAGTLLLSETVLLQAGFTPLMLAAKLGHGEVLQVLVSGGSDVDACAEVPKWAVARGLWGH